MQRGAGSLESSSVAPEPTAEVEMLRVEAKSLNTDVERLTIQVKAMDVQAEAMEALQRQNALLLVQVDGGGRAGTHADTKTADGATRSPAIVPLRGK